MEVDERGIAMGSEPSDLKSRKRYIMDFYAWWIAANPSKRVYNRALGGYIEVRFLSIQETSSRAAIRYRSTLAVTFLSEILAKGVVSEAPHPPKSGKSKQKRFALMNVLIYEKADFGRIKLIVGELRGSGSRIQYCITSVD
jgi:hypothetical protein